MTISIDDLDLTKQCDERFEFEVTDDATGKGTGIFLSVVGAHAAIVQACTRKELNARRLADAMRERSGKGATPRPVEADMDFGTEMVAVRIVGWRGLSDPCTHDNAVKLCRVNPLIKEQVLKVSEDLANFLKQPDKN